MASKSAAFWEKRSKSEGLRPLPCVTAHVQASYVQGSPVGSHRVGETAPAAKTLPFPNGNTIPVRPTYASIEASSVSHETAKKSAPSAKTVEFDASIKLFAQTSSATSTINNGAENLLQVATIERDPSTFLSITASTASLAASPVVSQPAIPNKYEELIAFLAPLRHIDVFAHTMAIRDIPNAPPLADSMHIRAIDVERWCRNQALTEIGMVSASRRGMTKIKTPGDHGINYLKKISIVHQRVVPNAHLKNEIHCIGDPESSKYGPTVFVTLEQALETMETAFQMPITGCDPSNLCAIVVLGHDVKGDMEMLLEPLKFQDRWGVIVAIIDTQQIAREVGWAGKNKISLKNLVTKVGFEYRDEHTPANDIAMTIICAT